jgi:hypothetical protein
MKPVVPVLLVLIYNTSFAQDTTYRRSPLFYTMRSTDLLIGVHWQGNSRDDKTLRYYEIGLARGKYISTMESYFGMAVYASEEMYFGRDKNIYGTKIGAWAHWLFDVGASAVYYTDFKRGNFKIRPELGFGAGRLRIVGGYNIPTINNKAFDELRRNNWQASIQTTVGLRKKKTDN